MTADERIALDTTTQREEMAEKTRNHRDAVGGERERRNCLVVGFVGRLTSHKSPGLFLLAMKEVYLQLNSDLSHSSEKATSTASTATNTNTASTRGLVFLVVGSGPLLSGLKAYAQYIGIGTNVHFAGLSTHSEITKYYQIMDILGHLLACSALLFFSTLLRSILLFYCSIALLLYCSIVLLLCSILLFYCSIVLLLCSTLLFYCSIALLLYSTLLYSTLLYCSIALSLYRCALLLSSIRWKKRC